MSYRTYKRLVKMVITITAVLLIYSILSRYILFSIIGKENTYLFVLSTIIVLTLSISCILTILFIHTHLKEELKNEKLEIYKMIDSKTDDKN